MPRTPPTTNWTSRTPPSTSWADRTAPSTSWSRPRFELVDNLADVNGVLILDANSEQIQIEGAGTTYAPIIVTNWT